MTVLSDTSVMVRWTAVPAGRLGGLNVTFYKIQFRRVGGRKSRGWETLEEDIPNTKHALRVNRLRPGWLPSNKFSKFFCFDVWHGSR